MRDPTAAEMRRFLKKRHGTEADDFDVESAIYWFANDWHGGQSSNLYSALSTSDYRPGASERGPTDHAAIMYADLEDWTGAERKGTLAKEDRPGRRNPPRRRKGWSGPPPPHVPDWRDQSDMSYRGYRIRVNALSNSMWVEKDGYQIVAPSQTLSWDKAKKIIDELVD